MERVLSYGDVLLRRHDVDLLNPPNFINDNIIDFFLSYLSSSSSNTILMVSPSTSFWIVNCPDPQDLSPFLAPLHLHSRHLILFPVNNSGDLDYDSSHGHVERGSHWSLLVFHRHRNQCLHFDSMAGTNDAYARSLHSKVAELVFPSSAAASLPGFVSVASPQQRNGYDCGAYVMAAAAAIKRGAERDGEEWSDVEGEVALEVSVESVAKLRRSTMVLIESLSQSSKA